MHSNWKSNTIRTERKPIGFFFWNKAQFMWMLQKARRPKTAKMKEIQRRNTHTHRMQKCQPFLLNVWSEIGVRMSFFPPFCILAVMASTIIIFGFSFAKSQITKLTLQTTNWDVQENKQKQFFFQKFSLTKILIWGAWNSKCNGEIFLEAKWIKELQLIYNY